MKKYTNTTAQAAHVIYDESSSDNLAQLGAKHELAQQIFTKTMSIQVWKPEHERAGRHFVYTGRYVSFFVKLLVQLGDRASLEALGRRVRKKPGDFVDHASVWSEVCAAHLKVRVAQPLCIIYSIGLHSLPLVIAQSRQNSGRS